MIHIFRRKLPSKYVGMGYWNNIVLFLCFFAIITVQSQITQNILLFAFSSQQIVTIFPKLYESGKDILLGNTEIYEVVTNAANSVLESVVNATTVASTLVFDQVAATDGFLGEHSFVDSPFEPYC